MARIHLDVSEFGTVFATVQHGSWRWECQGDYQVDHEEMRRWLSGEPSVEDEEDRAWIRYINGLRQAGIPFQRVRVLTEPLNDYLRWMVDTTNRNIEAGEDIRWLQASQAERLGMPEYDFYLLDDNRVVILNFDDSLALTGADVLDDDDTVRLHQAHRDRVWQHAVPHHEYVKGRSVERST